VVGEPTTTKRIKSFCFFFQKEALSFFFEKKRIASGDRENQKTFARVDRAK